ncbi:MAG: sphingomyelin phosphodiesterase [Cyclobacteriaceae bacterium]|nr:sphingomyelin phosphodiesterase [Cyclobacteriaceae bacterium]
MKALLLALSSIFFAPVAFSQQEKSPTGAEKIKILSWNIYMLPGFLSPGKVPRAEAIGKLLSSRDYDVIVFQEAFHKKSRKTISRHLQSAFPFQMGPANQKFFSLKTNSGIWIFSRYPISETHSIIFKTRYGTDALSRKGALLIELKVNNHPIQIIGTHLQNAGDDWRRQSQCMEIFNLLEEHKRPGVPQIVCGDFNVTRYGTDKDYEMMLETLNADDGEITGEKLFSYDQMSNDLLSSSGTQQDIIDYILVRSNQTNVVCSDRKIKVHQQRWNSNHQDLSDHYSVETEISYQPHSEVYTVSIPGLK